MAMKLELDVKNPNFKSSQALSEAGLILKLTTTADELDTAGVGDCAFGVALKKTEDPFNAGSYLAGEQVPVMFRGIAELRVHPQNKTIGVGDILVTESAGMVNKGSFAATNAIAGAAELGPMVGVALAAVASSTGGAVRALVDIRPQVHV